MAQQIHAVLRLAYAQEAQLLGLADFPPLQRSVADLQADADAYVGARIGSPLVGAVAFGPDPEGGQLLVSVLVVMPAFQRRGVARGLMNRVLSLAGPWPVAVTTAQANAPALALYESLGFAAYRLGSVGPEDLPVVKLRFSPSRAASADQRPAP